MDNQFSIRAVFDKWAGSDAAVTFSFSGAAIIRRDTCMFIMTMLIHHANESGDIAAQDVRKVDKRIVDLIRELQTEGRW